MEVLVLNKRLKAVVDKIGNPQLRRKVADFLQNPTVKVGGKSYSGIPIDRAPASLSHHHNYPGGLVEHVASTCEIALSLLNIARKVYNAKIDRDLVLCGVILHDLFKPLSYAERSNGTYIRTPLAERVDHLTLISSELIRRGFPLELVHVVCSSHGEEFSPIGPRTVEALICHLADLIDSRFSGDVLRAARYLAREATGEDMGRITTSEALKIVSAKQSGGWNGVRDALRKLGKGRSKPCR